MHYPLQAENILKTKKIAMATKVKNTLSSLYETEGSPCGRVFGMVYFHTNRLLKLGVRFWGLGIGV